jgi:hypothetical protein
MHSVFRINPKPKYGEELTGFLLRLASLNGFITIKELFSAIGVVFTEYSFKRTSKLYSNLLATLAPMIQLNVQALRQCFDSMSFLKMENNDASKSLQSKSPTICIECIKETGYIRESWQCYHLTYCDVHNCELNTHCPNCSGRLSWNIDLLAGCNQCGYRWHEHPLLSSTRPDYLSFIGQLDEKTEQNVFLSALYKAFCELTQPFSFAAKKPDFNQYSNRALVEKFTLAYQLLTSKTSMLLFFETVHTELSSQMQFYSFDLLKKLEHPIKNIHPNFFQSEYKNTPAFKLEKFKSALINEVQAGLLLGISPISVSTLNNFGYLSSINVNKTRQYELSNIDNFMFDCLKRAEQFEPENVEHFLNLSDLHSMSAKHLLSCGEALNFVLKSNLTIYVDLHPKNLSDFYINRNEFIALISTQNDNETSHLLSYTELAEYLCTNRLKVAEYAEHFGWKTVLTSRNIKKFDRFDVYETMESYVFLDRWCGFKPYPKNGLDSYLQQHGFRSVVSATKGTSLHVYKASSKLIKLIEAYEQLWLKLQSPQKVREQCKRKNIPFVPFNKKLMTPDFQLYPYPAEF